MAILIASAATVLPAAEVANEKVAASEADAARAKFFENKVRPLLAARCYKCHGPKKQNGKLRLDSRAGVLAGGESGVAVVPGKPDESLLLEAVNYESLEMPPDGKLAEHEIAVLETWIKLGAVWPGSEEDAPATVRRTAGFTPEDRAYWAFQPLLTADPPEIDDQDWSRSPIDQFVYRRLIEAKLTPAPEASRATLLRRATFDLWGLPPTPEQLAAFQQDDAPDAYERMIDRLLESPRYGERWAQHWLDLVRYADSNGYKADEYRPHAWRYRDYVIRSLNEDKPYDRFVQEQLAGDELAPDDPQVVVATGFLRHWSYESNQRNVAGQWADILNDVTDVTADVFLGLGMGCARCHDHKYDPILRKDYYRLQAFFTPLLPRTDMSLANAEQRQALQHWTEKTAGVRAKLDKLSRPHWIKAGHDAISKFPQEYREMMLKPAGERKPLEHQLAELALRQVEVTDKAIASRMKGEQKSEYESLREELAKFDKLKPQGLPPAFIVTDVGPEAPPTYIPGSRDPEAIPPGFLTLLDPEPAAIQRVPTAPQSTGRRTALARWITRPDNSLTLRVIVNRLWQHHFGAGIVSTSSDFGRLGDRPSHPELLDWLARRFVAQGWSLKALHREIMNSATYRQQAVVEPPAGVLVSDPENRLLWRANIRRLDAEQIRDAALAASGELKLSMGGAGADASQPRRTIYTKVIRNSRDPLLDVFDVPYHFDSTPVRNITTTPTQSLLMINGKWMLARARLLAKRVRSAGGGEEAAIRRAYRIAWGRDATPDEMSVAAEFLRNQRERIAAQRAELPQPKTAAMPGDGGEAALIAPGSGQDRLIVPDDESLPSADFTIEAYVLLRSLDAGAKVRVIASQWDGNTSHPGWSFGVTSTRSKYQPRNLILQLVGREDSGKPTYEVVASNLRPELNKPYYVAASVKFGDAADQRITFSLRDLTSKAPPQTAQVEHDVEGNYRAQVPLVLGNRAGESGHGWDGLIDRVRLSRAALAPEQLSIFGDQAGKAIVGDWRLDRSDDFFRDASPLANHIDPLAGGSHRGDPPFEALVDFCHVLLNASEFCYID